MTSRMKEMETELKSLRDETRKLKEEKEDLQAQVINGGVIAGRNVLQNAASISIADELGSLSDNQVSISFFWLDYHLDSFIMFALSLFCTVFSTPAVSYFSLFSTHCCAPIFRNFQVCPVWRSTKR